MVYHSALLEYVTILVKYNCKLEHILELAVVCHSMVINLHVPSYYLLPATVYDHI